MFCLTPDEPYFQSLIEGSLKPIDLRSLSDAKLNLYSKLVSTVEKWAWKEGRRISQEEDRRAELEAIEFERKWNSRERIGA